MPNRDYQNERREYEFAQLNRESIHLNPFLQFAEWMDHAHQSQLSDPTAMTLATVSDSGRPKSRIVLLKSFDEQGFVFYTHYGSEKGKNIAHNPQASVLFFWPELDRQIRIEGVIEKTSNTVSDAYFQSRPFDSQLAAATSEQSEIVPGRKTLEMNIEIARQAQNESGGSVERPQHWGGYVLKADYFEFWQGRANRLHDRFVYSDQNTNTQSWSIERLAP